MKKDAIHSTKTGTWDKTTHWPVLIQWTRTAAGLTKEETGMLSRNLAGEILAATAYISNCKAPERTAVTHLTTLVADLRCGEIYNHQPGETLMERLLPVYHYPGGSTDAVKAGMLLLEYLSLKDHKEDVAEDIVNGKQNPLVLELNYKEERERILNEYNDLPASIKETFHELHDRAIKARWWWP